ncbi:hypothetical protein CSW58_08800 [Caulobacter sp. B11]|uniref:glycosyltransferase family 4 protein n=1 Tax=Caulobacter sp. B11 TaxID=2048899 RepID=UPI000C12D845|nr:glycosyltransferase family 4 protein [Caulobacter sp. B11]PHY12988.1 hypothetical protein CSW58_08800 [Caulobacter sp. B11]
MRIAFYLDHTENSDFRSIMNGDRASSGSVASAIVFIELAKNHSVTIFHRMNNVSQLRWHEAQWIHVSGYKDFCQKIIKTYTKYHSKDNSFDFIVIRHHPDLFPIANNLSLCTAKKIVMLNNDIAPIELEKLVSLGFSRAVVRSKSSSETYELTHLAPIVEIIPHALPHLKNLRDIPSLRTPPAVMWVGATREEKGFHHALRAWPIIRKMVPDAELHVFGSIRLHFPESDVGPSGVLTPEFEIKYLLPIVGKHRSPEDIGIYFKGATSKSDIFDFAMTAYVGLVNPNINNSTETFCISALELQSMGCPCVGGKSGGLLDTIDDGVSGILVPTENPVFIAEAVARILKDPKLREELSRGAIAHAAKFGDIQREAKAWTDVFERTASQTASPSLNEAVLARLVRSFRSILLARIAGKLFRIVRSPFSGV